MDQRSTKANATSETTMNGAVIQSKLWGSLTYRKGYYVSLFLHLDHITALFLLFASLSYRETITIISEKACLDSQNDGFVFLYCEKKEKKFALLTRQKLDETQRKKTQRGRSSLGRNDRGKKYGAWGKIKREGGRKVRKDCRKGRRERKVLLQRTIEQ